MIKSGLLTLNWIYIETNTIMMKMFFTIIWLTKTHQLFMLLYIEIISGNHVMELIMINNYNIKQTGNYETFEENKK